MECCRLVLPSRVPVVDEALCVDRLTSELPLAQASDLDSANAYCASSLATTTVASPVVREKCRGHGVRLLKIWTASAVFVHQRVVSNDNIAQWEGQRFQIPQQGQRFTFAGAKVQLYQALDGRVSLYYGDTGLQHSFMLPLE